MKQNANMNRHSPIN